MFEVKMKKKKIGFIDLFIDEWHANNYPQWFRTAPRASEFELGLAWEAQTKEGLRPLEKWCADLGMTPAKTLEEVVEDSDCICVLAPSNPEEHERLAEIPLKSGKPLYIDKPFAPSRAAADRIFAMAEKYSTPLMSSSALRFGDELLSGELREMKPAILCTTGGGSSFDEYGIHQLEMIVSVMGTDVKDLRLAGDTSKLSLLIEYADGRLAHAAYAPCHAFSLTAGNEQANRIVPALTNVFPNLIAAMMDFFITGKSPIAPEETITINDKQRS